MATNKLESIEREIEYLLARAEDDSPSSLHDAKADLARWAEVGRRILANMGPPRFVVHKGTIVNTDALVGGPITIVEVETTADDD